MNLSEKQKTIIRLINDDRFTEQVCEKYWKENAAKMGKGNSNYTFHIAQIGEVNAFMRAVTGIETILDERENRGEHHDT